MPLLPIALRENRRPECERVLWALRERPSGVVSASPISHFYVSASMQFVTRCWTVALRESRTVSSTNNRLTLAVADLTAALGSSGSTSVPQVRINEILLALVRAKIAIKQLSKVRRRLAVGGSPCLRLAGMRNAAARPGA